MGFKRYGLEYHIKWLLSVDAFRTHLLSRCIPFNAYHLYSVLLNLHMPIVAGRGWYAPKAKLLVLAPRPKPRGKDRLECKANATRTRRNIDTNALRSTAASDSYVAIPG